MRSLSKSVLLAVFFVSPMSLAAIPQQALLDCYRSPGGTSLTIEDYKALSKISKQTFCQKTANSFAKADLIEILKNQSEIGISVAGTQWSKYDLIEVAKSGKMTLIVDGLRFNRENLLEIAKGGAQLAITTSSGFLKDDLIAIAREVPLVVAVTSNLIKDDLKQLAASKIQLVIFLSDSGIGNYDLIDIVKSNPEMVSIKP